MLPVVLATISALSFSYYGSQTLFAHPPRGEYERYGMPRVRVLAGTLQLLGAAGVLIGIFFTPVGIAAAAGLTLMMLLGLLTRWKIHDAPRLMVPAGSLATLNGILTLLFILR